KEVVNNLSKFYSDYYEHFNSLVQSSPDHTLDISTSHFCFVPKRFLAVSFITSGSSSAISSATSSLHSITISSWIVISILPPSSWNLGWLYRFTIASFITSALEPCIRAFRHCLLASWYK